MSIPILAITIFLALFGGAIIILLHLSRSRDPIERRLRDVRDGGVAVESGPGGAPSLLVTIDPASYSSLRADLTRAGFRGRNAVTWYWILRVLAALLLGAIGFWFQRRFIAQGAIEVLLPAGAALGGFALPYWIVHGRVTKRRENIRRSIPNVLDLIIVCVEAGLSLNAAIQRIAKEMRHTYPELASELSILNQEFFLGVGRAEAFRNLALRTGVDELRSLATVLMQSDRLGTSIAEVLRVQAEILRTKRRQRAMEDAQKMPIKLLFPLILFIFPALLVVILGPAAITLYRSLTAVSR
ncbi:MAG: type II secretion system F family protein [candidate division Zixibacteria bacterium]|nr:type II secretion system F family protein [candidate division Zixibacteria bacterium]